MVAFALFLAKIGFKVAINSLLCSCKAVIDKNPQKVPISVNCTQVKFVFVVWKVIPMFEV